MKLLYTHPNRILVENARNLLENAGIATRLENEFAGGAIGELAPINAWVELWIVRERDEQRAKEILAKLSRETEGPGWTCPQCGENNDASFELCWRCQTERPT